MKDKLRYILDPKEVHGEGFAGESFRLLKENEIAARLASIGRDVSFWRRGISWRGGGKQRYTGKQVAEAPVKSCQSPVPQ